MEINELDRLEQNPDIEPSTKCIKAFLNLYLQITVMVNLRIYKMVIVMMKITILDATMTVETAVGQM